MLTTLYRHGLSYTTFSLSNLSIQPTIKTVSPLRNLSARLTVKNTGSVAGSEILQLYISAPESSTQRPVKELHGFEKVHLEPGEEREVEIKIDEYATSFWDESERKWCSEKGNYKVIVSTSSAGGKAIVESSIEVQKTRWWLGL